MTRDNDNFYIAEAFNRLKLLEDDFNLTADQGVVDELKSFVADDILAPEEEVIIDVEADEPQDLQDSYLGKVILECSCCHTRIYKDASEVFIDDEGSELANIDEECPVCGNALGYNVIGKIEPFEENDVEFKDDLPVEEIEDQELDFTDEEITEALKEELSEKEQRDLNNDVYNALGDVAYEYEVNKNIATTKKDFEKATDNFNNNFFAYIDDEDLNESVQLREDVQEIKELVREVVADKLFDLNDNLAYEVASKVDGYSPDWCESDGFAPIVTQANLTEEEYIEALLDILFANAPKNESLKEDIDIHIENPGEDTQVEITTDDEEIVMQDDTPEVPMEVEVDDGVLEVEPVNEAKKVCPKCGKEPCECNEDCDKKVNEELLAHGNENLGANPNVASDDTLSLEDDQKDLVIDGKKLKEEINQETASEDAEELDTPGENPVVDLKEGIENLSLDTEDTHMEMTADDNGKVVITTEPLDNTAEEVVDIDSGEETIAPLSDEEIAEIEANVPGEEVEVAEPELPAEEDEFAIDEFDEETFDELGESFLRRVYENVNSFKVNEVSYDKGKLVVEGLIKFNSGKESKTSFKFENFKTTRRGKVMVEGLNETFSKSNRAFLLKGTLKDKHFISESLTYNYTAKSINESNESESVKIYGRAVVKK